MSKAKNILSVSQLNQSAKRALEQHLPSVWVQGELTNLAQPSSGHWYFTLKDARAQVRCAMFRGKNMAVSTPIRAGDQVLLSANVSLYEGRGDYQLIVNSLQKAGLGDLHQQYEALKNALAAEGLFDAQAKRALPAMPKVIGVISSPSGAAVHDILTVLKRRYPIANVIIYPAQVQGTDAPQSLLKALALANRQQRCDVLILGRGGGSLEDLWGFNNEQLVRSVYNSTIPVISAVGHEIDFTLTDFVADLRAPTPSAAAEAAVPDITALKSVLAQKKAHLQGLCETYIAEAKRRVALARMSIQSPKQALQNHQQRLDYFDIRLRKAMGITLTHSTQKFRSQAQRLTQNSPLKHVTQAKQTQNQLQHRLNKVIKSILGHKRQAYISQVSVLNALSPLNTLQRGYAIARTPQGKVISKIQHVKPYSLITITLKDGKFEAITQ